MWPRIAAVSGAVACAALAAVSVGRLDSVSGTVLVILVPAVFALTGALSVGTAVEPRVAGLVMGTGLAHLLALTLSGQALLSTDGIQVALHALSGSLYAIGFAGLVWLATTYPLGTVESAGARLVVAVCLGSAVLPVLAMLAGPTPALLQSESGGAVEIGPAAHALPEWVATAAGVILALPLLAAGVLAFRYVRGAAPLRKRLRWPLLAVLVIGVLAVSSVALGTALPRAADVVFLLIAPVLPVALVLGSLADPPDVDRWLRRTAVFGGTWTLAAAAYGVGVGVSAWTATARGVAVAALMGAVLSIMLAAPVRRRLLALADERERLVRELEQQVEALRRRSDELDQSRRRVATAAESERIRMERDLHDGVQQEILALMAQVELARRLPAESRDVALVQAQEQVASVYARVHEISRGVRPALLEDRGLVQALGVLASQSPVGAELLADPALTGRRWPDEFEGCLYFCASEALSNVVKHTSATRVRLELTADTDRLVLRVSDDGGGTIDPDRGSGIRGLRDRLESLGGVLCWERANGWTSLTGALPLPADSSRPDFVLPQGPR